MLAAAVAELSAGSAGGQDALMRPSPGYPRSGRHMCMDEAPRPMLWWTATHQVHTSRCTGPLT